MRVDSVITMVVVRSARIRAASISGRRLLRRLVKYAAMIRVGRKSFKKYSSFTMIPRLQYLGNLDLADRVRNVQGCIVECGTWRGGMIAGIAQSLGPEREYVLFDSFEGLPRAEDIDGLAAQAWQADITSPSYYNNCTAERNQAEQAMALAHVARPEIVAGWFNDTVPAWALEGRQIALLRLDGDWYESTLVCLRNLFPLVVPGGLIVLDDYFVWEGCTRAVHQYLSEAQRPESIRTTKAGVPYIEKR